MPTVRDIMATEIVTIGPGAPIHQAVDILLDKRISGLPVVDGALPCRRPERARAAPPSSRKNRQRIKN